MTTVFCWHSPVGHLDKLGCGNGVFTEVVVELCRPSAVQAFDPSSGQLAYARNRGGTSDNIPISTQLQPHVLGLCS